MISRVRLACALAIPLALLADARAASLLYSNDVLGEIEPCGCRVDPRGGLVRRSGLLERLKKEGKGPFVQVDGGDLLFETKDFPESLEKSRRLQAEALLEAYGRMGLDAFVPGEKDFALGLKTLRSLLAKSKVKALAANLMEGDKPAFPGSAVFEAKGADGKVVRVGVIGLVGESIEYPAPLKVEPRLPAFEREKAALAGKTDLLVVISHSGMEPDLELAKKLSGVAIIVGGHTQSFTQDPPVENGIPIVQASYRGQHQGVVPLESISKPETFQLVGLDVGYDKDGTPAVRKIVERAKKALAKAGADLLKKRSK